MFYLKVINIFWKFLFTLKTPSGPLCVQKFFQKWRCFQPLRQIIKLTLNSTFFNILAHYADYLFISLKKFCSRRSQIRRRPVLTIYMHSVLVGLSHVCPILYVILILSIYYASQDFFCWLFLKESAFNFYLLYDSNFVQ